MSRCAGSWCHYWRFGKWRWVWRGGQGNVASTGHRGGGGGGGASSAGASSTADSGVNGNAGNGGAGTDDSITGSPVTYAGGGGGGAGNSGVVGTGGTGGGGRGGDEAGNAPTAGAANTGGGGGGSGGSGAGGAGGSGVVIIRYPNPNPIFNVMDYGATGDGSTSDTDAIRSAAAAACACPTGAELYFPRGAYKITGTIDINQFGIRIATDGEGATNIIFNPASEAFDQGGKVYASSGTALFLNRWLRNVLANGDRIVVDDNHYVLSNLADSPGH